MTRSSSQPPILRHEERFAIPGGVVVVEYARPFPGTIPIASIVSQPEEASPEKTRIRDQVDLLDCVRKWGKPRLLDMLIDADTALRPVFMPAKALMDAPAFAEGAAA